MEYSSNTSSKIVIRISSDNSSKSSNNSGMSRISRMSRRSRIKENEIIITRNNVNRNEDKKEIKA